MKEMENNDSLEVNSKEVIITEGYWITVPGTLALDTIIHFYFTEGY